MNTKNILKFVAILFIAISFSSCVEDGDFTIPTLGADKEYTNLKSLSEISELYTNRLVEFDEEVVTYGYVVSNDRDGNFFKSIFIQDSPENPTIGFEVKINDTKLNARYAVGRKIFIKLKGLYLNKIYGGYQIGIRNTFGNGVDRIGVNDYVYFIDRSSEIADLVPAVVDIEALTESNINTLVKVNNIQSETEGLQYAAPSSSGVYSINRIMISCDSSVKLILRNSVFATFNYLSIPDKKGSITGVFNIFQNDKQLTIRDTNDVDFTEEYGCFNNPTAAYLAEIKALFTTGEVRISQNSKIKVVITSDLANGNISNTSAFAQEETTAIALNFSDAYDLNLGDEIEIGVGGLTLSEYNGLLRLNLSTSNILSKTNGTLPTPEVITVAQALSGDYESKLVTIEGVQFKDITKMYSGTNSFTSDCSDVLKTFFRNDTSFSTNQVSGEKGSLTGIMTDVNEPQIYIRDDSDVNFTEAYACTPTPTNAIFFSELADPNNNAGARYIEIYNASTNNVDLSGWTIRRYTNDATTVSSSLDLTGSTINNGQAFVIAANATAFQTTFGVAPDLEAGTGGPADSNGDDNLELVDPNGNVVDTFGLPGEDGTGTDHQFEDGRANRKHSVTQANTTYTFAEWDVWNDSGNSGTTNAPQNAPGTFTPKVR
jgi:hypothetical protein